jgi:hypothetical protein
MKKNYLLLWICFGVLVSTIGTAYYSANEKRSDTVFAQGAFGVVGCFERFEKSLNDCSCEGIGQGTNESDNYGSESEHSVEV